jgi:hypothetical protein
LPHKCPGFLQDLDLALIGNPHLFLVLLHQEQTALQLVLLAQLHLTPAVLAVMERFGQGI